MTPLGDILTRYRFSTSGVLDANKGLQKFGVFFVVPISKDDGIFIIVFVSWCGFVNDNWSTKTVDVVSLQMIFLESLCVLE